MAFKNWFITLNTTIEIEPKSNDIYYKQSYKSDIQSFKFHDQGKNRQIKIKFFNFPLKKPRSDEIKSIG